MSSCHHAGTLSRHATSSNEQSANPGLTHRGHSDRYRVYPRLVDELFPAAFHRMDARANNLLETTTGASRLDSAPMRGLKRDRTARVIVAGHAFIQNVRRGFYDLGTDVPSGARLADAFAELAQVI